MGVKLLTEHHLEFLSFKGGCTGSSESILVKFHIVGNHMSLLNYNLCFALNVQRVHLCAALTAISWMLEPFGKCSQFGFFNGPWNGTALSTCLLRIKSFIEHNIELLVFLFYP